MDTQSKYQPFIYMAASRNSDDPYKDTELYRFRLINGAMERVTEVPVYARGYDALAFRPADGLLYAMDHAADNRDTLLVIDPMKGTIKQLTVSGMPEQGMAFALGDIAHDGKTYVVGGGAQSPTVEIDLTQEKRSAKSAGFVPGAGGHYDWAFHPVDRRLYAVDGDTGALLVFDLAVRGPKHELKAQVFPKADGPPGSGARRPVYGAVFFSDEGMMYAVDSAGHVYSLDLKKSTVEKPIAGADVPKAELVGGGAVRIPKGLRVTDAAGCVLKPIIPPQYIDPLAITAELTNTSNTTWLPPNRQVSGFTYSWLLTLTAKDLISEKPMDVRTFRIQFARPENGEALSTSDLEVKHAENGPNGMIYLNSIKDDHLIPGGGSLKINCQVFISGNKLEKPVLVGLSANRLS